MLGQWHQDVLRLFEVIASPILVFAPNGELICAQWPHARQGMGPEGALNRAQIQAAAHKLAQSWSRNIGEPQYLQQAQDLGGIRLPDNLLVIIGPLAPLKVTLAGTTHFLENRTALLACNMWLNLHSAFSRRCVHESPEEEPLVEESSRVEPNLPEPILDSAFAASFEQALAPTAEPKELVTREQVEQELSQLLGLKLQALPDAEEHKVEAEALGLQALLSSNFDLSRIVAAQGTAYNPFNGNFTPNVVTSEDEEAFVASLHLGKISTVHHHNQLRNEVLMQEAVREGNMDKLRWANSLPTKGKAGILGLTPLRSWQNHAHISNILASRAAIDAGIAPEEAYVLSDKLFLVVEQITDPLLAKYMRWVIWRVFTEQVRRHHNEVKVRQQTLVRLTQTEPKGDDAAASSELSARPEPVLVLKARYLMTQRLMEPLTLEQIAAELDCTPEHLARSFKRYHHQTVHQYLVAERIKLAKELLLESNQKVSDIAQLLHFSSSSHFGAVFKEREHLSPLKWRKLHAKIFEG